jgi:hypothetical protein
VDLSEKVAAVVSIAWAVAGVAGYWGADEVLPACRVTVYGRTQARFASFRVTPARMAYRRLRQAPVGTMPKSSPRRWHRLRAAFRTRFSCRAGTWSPWCVGAAEAIPTWTDPEIARDPRPGDIVRRGRAAGARSASGPRIHGCSSYTVAGRRGTNWRTATAGSIWNAAATRRAPDPAAKAHVNLRVHARAASAFRIPEPNP